MYSETDHALSADNSAPQNCQPTRFSTKFWTGHCYWSNYCTSSQLKFQIFRNNKSKIGMNMTTYKFYCISNLIVLDMLNMSFVHYKKLIKMQFLKYGKMWKLSNWSYRFKNDDLNTLHKLYTVNSEKAWVHVVLGMV